MAIAIALVTGLAATSFAVARAAAEAPEGDTSACTDCDCLAPEVCGGEETVCPAGPDCWMPDACPEQTVICPAGDAPRAAE